MKRCAIVGTAPSWKQAPWDDPDITIVSLNDAHMLRMPRVDEWFEQHPLSKLWFRPRHQKAVYAKDIPPGHYVRPEGHLEFLKRFAMTNPVWTADEPPADWPANARRYPIEEMEAKYGTYWASGPAYMIPLLYERGYREFQIYGIHLATEHEYREQRPNWEMWLGRLLGMEATMRVEGDTRIWEGNECRVVMPKDVPILHHPWRYAYDPRPEAPPDPLKTELKAVQKQIHQLVRDLVNWPTGKDKARALDQLTRLEVIEEDIQRVRSQRRMSTTLEARLRAA